MGAGSGAGRCVSKPWCGAGGSCLLPFVHCRSSRCRVTAGPHPRLSQRRRLPRKLPRPCAPARRRAPQSPPTAGRGHRVVWRQDAARPPCLAAQRARCRAAGLNRCTRARCPTPPPAPPLKPHRIPACSSIQALPHSRTRLLSSFPPSLPASWRSLAGHRRSRTSARTGSWRPRRAPPAPASRSGAQMRAPCRCRRCHWHRRPAPPGWRAAGLREGGHGSSLRWAL